MELPDASLIDEVQANAWPAPLIEVVGRWQLRLSPADDRRTNSVWTIGEPDCGIEAAVEVAEAFYDRRGLSTEVRVGASSPSALTNLLLGRGYHERDRHPLVCVADTSALEAPHSPRFLVETRSDLTDAWYRTYLSGEDGRYPDTEETASWMRPLLFPGPQASYVSARDGDEVVAVGQGVVGRGICMVQCVATRPERRRQGAARALFAGLRSLAMDQRAPVMCLAVQESNLGARLLYESMGFELHHRCRYFFRPPQRDRRPSADSER